MVNVVVCGGSGAVGRHIAQAIKSGNRHSVVVFSRRDHPSIRALGIPVHVVDYSNHAQLVQSLQHVHTVISTMNGPDDRWLKAQGNVLRAAIEAGVRRFAPSDFGPMPGPIPYAPNKDVFAHELDWTNNPSQVIETTLFKCGFLVNQLAPLGHSSGLALIKPFIDFECMEAIIPGTGQELVTLTQVEDLARFVAASLDIPEGRWPYISGIVGMRTSVSDLCRLAESIRGRPFRIYRESISDLQAGIISSASEMRHSYGSERRPLTIQFLLALAYGMFNVPPTMNAMFPHLVPLPVSEYLARKWKTRRSP